MGKLTDLLNLAQARTRELGFPYAGALTPKEAYEVLQLAPGAKLVDVRTRAEWDWVGRIPGAEEIEWQSYPDNQPNSFFLAQLKQHRASAARPKTGSKNDNACGYCEGITFFEHRHLLHGTG